MAIELVQGQRSGKTHSFWTEVLVECANGDINIAGLTVQSVDAECDRLTHQLARIRSRYRAPISYTFKEGDIISVVEPELPAEVADLERHLHERLNKMNELRAVVIQASAERPTFPTPNTPLRPE